jgi:hypothetical protein
MFFEEFASSIVQCIGHMIVATSWPVLRAFPTVLSMWPYQNISHIQVLVFSFFPTPPIKLKLGLQMSGRLLIATHLDQSNYLPNQQ